MSEERDTEIIKYTQCGHERTERFPMKYPPYPVETELKIDATCARCMLEEVKRDVKAQAYLTRKMVERFTNSPVERFRRWSHNTLHRVQFGLGHKFCFACNMLTHNRLEPNSLDHARPASFYLEGR